MKPSIELRRSLPTALVLGAAVGAAFTPFVVLYGVMLYRIWCRRFVAGWGVHYQMIATA